LLPHPDPFSAFDIWYAEAEASEPRVPDAMQVATVDPTGHPRVRTVLLKSADRTGFVFYTNLDSRKGRDLTAHPAISAVLHWKSLERQVVIDGTVERVTDAEADAYFASRPRGSRVGAWASRQSQPVASRQVLLDAVAEAQARFAGQDHIPRPPHWSGFRIVPARVEFWQGRDDRLHERTVYTRRAPGWDKVLWQP